MSDMREGYATQLQRVVDLIKSGKREACFRVDGTCLAGAGIDDGDSVYIDFHHYPRKPLYKARGDQENRTDICLCFARYPGREEPTLMLKEYLGVGFQGQTVGTAYKDRSNCAFGAIAILGVVYAVFDSKGNQKWAVDPREFDTELTDRMTIGCVGFEPCGLLSLSK